MAASRPGREPILVLGAGMVGVSVALHLARRGHPVTILDRGEPGRGASYGNAGLVQREAVEPPPFPQGVGELARIAGNRAVDVHYHPTALPSVASPLLQYWRNSTPERYRRVVASWSKLIATCVDEHLAQAQGSAEAMAILRPTGYLRLFSTEAELAEAVRHAEQSAREHGVRFRVLDGAALAAAEPAIQVRRAGAIHWLDPLSASDPHGLVLAYLELARSVGVAVKRGDAASLRRHGAGWRVDSDDGPLDAAQAVIALGASAGVVTRLFSFDPPIFGKRGYHRHFRLQPGHTLHRPFLDSESRFVLIPMRAGIRLTTGVEFAAADAPPTPVQLERAEPIARRLLPLGEAVESEPWMGTRPATADMLPLLGRFPGQDGLWCAFGHAHQGFTLGPTTGRLLAEMIAGETPFVDPAPYDPARFT